MHDPVIPIGYATFEIAVLMREWLFSSSNGEDVLLKHMDECLMDGNGINSL